MDQTAKQQVVERLKGANNVLVTVSANPSVDQLAGAIALTLMINTMGKHATAVFSGQIPDTMQFLDPSKTLEATVDSLRDFIIALDKNKADKLRYKVEDDVVKIFITPYRTRIAETDLQFSQGDYNVDVVMALGVIEKNDLDKVIVEHGRILHDAAVISVNSGAAAGSLGAINWSDNTASSLCEMLMSISEALQAGLVDEQVATALLTGIVSETARFSNDKTSPKVMTMAAQLMAAGANQQLIASHLHPTITNASVVTESEAPKPVSSDPSEMAVAHESDVPSWAAGSKASTPPGDEPMAPISAPKSEPTPEPEPEPATAPEQPAKVEPGLPNSLPPGPISDMIHDTKAFAQNPDLQVEKPKLGGTFNATATEAHEAALRSKEQGINNTILNHDAVGEEAAAQTLPTAKSTRVVVEPETEPDNSPMVPLPPENHTEPEAEEDEPEDTSASEPAPEPPTSEPAMSPLPPPVATPAADDFAAPAVSSEPAPHIPLSIPTPAGELNPAAEAQHLDNETLGNIDASVRAAEAPMAAPQLDTIDLESARNAVEAAMGNVGFDDSANAVEPKQAIGINGRLDIHADDPQTGMPPIPQLGSADPSSQPPPAPPMFDMSPPASSPDGGFTPPPVFGEPSPEPITASMPPTIGQHEGGYVSSPPASIDPTPSMDPSAPSAPSPDDFTLPPIT